MYRKFREDPSSVDPSWHEFLVDYAPEKIDAPQSLDTPAQKSEPAAAKPAAPEKAAPAKPAPRRR